jgi:hypothetical protein
MKSLGTKFRVLNSDADIKIFNASGNPVTAATSVAATDTIKIAGFGNFPIADITDIQLGRAQAATKFSQEYDSIVPTGLAAGEAVEVIIDYKTSRYESELKNNYIGGGRPFIFQSAILGAGTPNATTVATAIIAGFAQYEKHFHMSDLPIKVVAASAGSDIQVDAQTSSITIKSVKIRRVDGKSTDFAATPLPAVSGSLTSAFEGKNLGKFLEESIRMATWYNEDPYCVDNIDSRVDIRGSYTSIDFSLKVPYEQGTLAAPTPGSNISLEAVHEFTLFVNEATIPGGSGIALLAGAGVAVAGNVTSVTASTTAAASMTLAKEKSEALIFSDGGSKATAALFIA